MAPDPEQQSENINNQQISIEQNNQQINDKHHQAEMLAQLITADDKKFIGTYPTMPEETMD